MCILMGYLNETKISMSRQIRLLIDLSLASLRNNTVKTCIIFLAACVNPHHFSQYACLSWLFAETVTYTVSHKLQISWCTSHCPLYVKPWLPVVHCKCTMTLMWPLVFHKNSGRKPLIWCRWKLYTACNLPLEKHTVCALKLSKYGKCLLFEYHEVITLQQSLLLYKAIITMASLSLKAYLYYNLIQGRIKTS